MREPKWGGVEKCPVLHYASFCKTSVTFCYKNETFSISCCVVQVGARGRVDYVVGVRAPQKVKNRCTRTFGGHKRERTDSSTTPSDAEHYLIVPPLGRHRHYCFSVRFSFASIFHSRFHHFPPEAPVCVLCADNYPPVIGFPPSRCSWSSSNAWRVIISISSSSHFSKMQGASNWIDMSWFQAGCSGIDDDFKFHIPPMRLIKLHASNRACLRLWNTSPKEERNLLCWCQKSRRCFQTEMTLNVQLWDNFIIHFWINGLLLYYSNNFIILWHAAYFHKSESFGFTNWCNRRAF